MNNNDNDDDNNDDNYCYIEEEIKKHPSKMGVDVPPNNQGTNTHIQAYAIYMYIHTYVHFCRFFFFFFFFSLCIFPSTE